MKRKKEAERLAREAEKEEREMKAQLEKLAREERMKDREYKQKQLELDKLEQAKILEIKLREREIELAEVKKASGISATVAPDIKVKHPKLPPFSEGKDSMDAFLKRFERFAEIAKWPKEEWATNLSTLLQGKAVDVYSRLSAEDAVKYDALKEALLTRYQLTEEGFRIKFRNARQEVGETAGQFVVRLNEYLIRWMELGKATKSFEGLKDLILREQFLAVSNKNLVMFLKERKVLSVSEMTALADQYIEAHSLSETTPRGFGNRNEGKVEGNRVKYRTGSENPPMMRPLQERVCYGCGKKDHFIKDCPHKSDTKSVGNVRAAAARTEVSPENENIELQDEDLIKFDTDTIPKSVATCISITPTTHFPITSQSSMKVDNRSCQSGLPLLNLLDEENMFDSNHRMPVKDGYIRNEKVSVLRDSGCNSAIIKKSLVLAEQYRSSKQKCILADGTVREFPVAEVQVDTPYFTGKVEVLCMDNPVYDLVLGNIKGVRPANNPDENWAPPVGNGSRQEAEVLSVETRAQRLRKGKENPLQVPNAIQEFSKADIAEGQLHDISLEKCKLKAASGEILSTKAGAKSWYVKENGLLYRVYQTKGEDASTVKQLIVPKSQRKVVLNLAHATLLSGHLGVRKTREKVLCSF